jgi:hypothetical protein
VRVLENTPRQLELLIELPRFLLWFMLAPIVLIAGFLALVGLLGGEFLDAISAAIVACIIAYVGYYFLTQTTRVRLEADTDLVRILRENRLERRTYEFALRHLDSAEVRHRTDLGGDNDGGANTSQVYLVFSNTQPATRVPLSGWAVAGAGAGILADAVNDWLRERRESSASADSTVPSSSDQE